MMNPLGFKTIQILKCFFYCIQMIFKKYFLKILIGYFMEGLVVNEKKHEKATRVSYDFRDFNN